MKIIAILGLLISLCARASITRIEDHNIILKNHALVVTHSSGLFDESAATRDGVNRLIQSFKQENKTVVYIVTDIDPEDELWLPTDKRPDIAISSVNGSHRMILDSPEVTLAGGFFTLCLDRSFADLLRNTTHDFSSPLKVNFKLNATYVDHHLFPYDYNHGPSTQWKLQTHHPVSLEEAINSVTQSSFESVLETVFNHYESDYSISIFHQGRRLWKSADDSLPRVNIHLI